MGAKTPIEWAGSSANPILARRLDTGKLGFHCVKVSPECARCYAEAFNLRNLPERGTGLPYINRSEETLEIILHRPVLEQVLRWRLPRRIFWCSMTDLFGEFVPSALIQEVLDVAAQVAEAPGHISQLLTKRPDRMLREVTMWQRRHGRRLPANVWPGFSAGDRHIFLDRWEQARHLRDLIDGPLWCSYEPAIGHLADPMARRSGEMRLWQRVADQGLRWVVWGGESGRKPRPFNALWGLAIVRYLAPAGILVFGKQLGAHPFCPFYLTAGDLDEGDLDGMLERFRARPRSQVVDADGRRWRGDQPPAGARVLARFGSKGGDFDAWPAALQLRQFPGAEAA